MKTKYFTADDKSKLFDLVCFLADWEMKWEKVQHTDGKTYVKVTAPEIDMDSLCEEVRKDFTILG